MMTSKQGLVCSSLIALMLIGSQTSLKPAVTVPALRHIPYSHTWCTQISLLLPAKLKVMAVSSRSFRTVFAIAVSSRFSKRRSIHP